MDARNLSGQVIKGYEIRELIGVGGFAAVYRAYQPTIDRETAMKVILPRFANDPEFIRRFEVEAQIIAHLEHIHIVPLYDYWREPNNAYLVMRFLRGGNLYQSIEQQGPWPIHAIAHLLEQVVSALAAAHRKGIVHRDLTPANILLDEEQNAYLADFGIAKDTVRELDPVMDAQLYGSPAYMAPERIRREPSGPQTDIYSLGIILYQLLTGALPFEAPTNTTLILKQLTEPLPPLQIIRPDLPYHLNTVIMHATHKDPAERFQDVISLLVAFRQVAQVDAERMKLPGPSAGESDQVEPEGSETIDLSSSVQAIDLDVDLRTIDIKPDDLLSSVLLAPENPYKGLRSFEAADSSDFFGRSGLVERLLSRLQADDDQARFVAVVGPSGSGKSSVVKAGLIPALGRGKITGSHNWFMANMVPGPHPFTELAAALLSVALDAPNNLDEELSQDAQGLVNVASRILPPGEQGTPQLVLIIDQFEELFTQVESETERSRFLDSLVTAATDPASVLRVVITLRADFYDRPLLYPAFGHLVQAHTEVVLPLSSAELQEAISGPAQRVGLLLEDGLVTEIVDDLREQPGALPLLQYSLTELFERREGRMLTLDGYYSSGGVTGALARRAEALYVEMNPSHQSVARQVFLRLVSLAEESGDTRRRAPYAELLAAAGQDKSVIHEVINTFANYRLLTLDHDPQTREPTAEVAHEALIGEWQRLREWLDENRDVLRLQRRLALAVGEWLKAGHDPSFLATGARFSQFETLRRSSAIALTPDEAAYLQASYGLRQRQVRRIQLFVATLVVFSVVALALALFAFDRENRAQHSRNVAQEARATMASERDRANQQARISRSRELAVTALSQTGDLDRALLLSMESLAAANTFEARSSLLTLLQSAPRLSLFLHGASDQVRSIAISPDGQQLAAADAMGTITVWDLAEESPAGRLLVTADSRINFLSFSPDGLRLATGEHDGTIRLWDAETGQAVGQPLSGHTGQVWSVAFSPDGQRLASAADDGSILLWDVETGKVIGEPLSGHSAEVWSVAFSPDGSLLASGGADNAVWLWDAQTGEPIGNPLTGHANWVWSVAFSPDGKWLASGSFDNTVMIWDVKTHEPLFRLPLEGHPGHTDWVRCVSFSPDGTWLASSGDDGTIRLWDATTGDSVGELLEARRGEVWSIVFSPDGSRLAAGAEEGVTLWDMQRLSQLEYTILASDEPINNVAFSPDGRFLAEGGSGRLVKLWDVEHGTQSTTLQGHSGQITAVAFNSDGTLLASAGEDRTVILWDLASHMPISEPLAGHTDAIFDLAFTPDGTLLASAGDDRRVMLWDTSTLTLLDELAGHTDGVLGLAFSSDGSLLASAGRDGMIILWDASTWLALGEPLSGHLDAVTDVAFSPDGTLLASSSRDGTIILWDVGTLQPLGRPLVGHVDQVLSVAFSPDGSLLASGSRDGEVLLWDVALRRSLGGPFVGHSDRVTSVQFSPDGTRLATGSYDTTILIWAVGLDTWQALGCHIANRNLSADEWVRYLPDLEYRAMCDFGEP